MALVGRVFVLFMVMAFVHVSNAAVYKVGDSAGWTTIGNVNYKQWAAIKTFEVGDIIRKFFFFFLIHCWILFSFWVLCILWELGLASSSESWVFIYVLSSLKLSSPQTKIYGIRLKKMFSWCEISLYLVACALIFLKISVKQVFFTIAEIVSTTLLLITFHYFFWFVQISWKNIVSFHGCILL